MRRQLVLLTAGLLGLGGVLAGATPAGAISRAQCGYDYLQVMSSQTTCWANSGTASVTLKGVYWIHSGKNAGYVSGVSECDGRPGRTTFGKLAEVPIFSANGALGCNATITTVHIN